MRRRPERREGPVVESIEGRRREGRRERMPERRKEERREDRRAERRRVGMSRRGGGTIEERRSSIGVPR
jgi:hypothetical protein